MSPEDSEYYTPRIVLRDVEFPNLFDKHEDAVSRIDGMTIEKTEKIIILPIFVNPLNYGQKNG